MAGENPSLRLHWHYLLIIALLAVSTTVLVGDFSVRMALTSADDSPLACANYMHNPQAYAHDAFAKNWTHVALGSMQTWLSVGLYNWLGLPPEITYYFWVFLQNVLLGLAVFRFAICVSSSPTVAWLSLALTFLGKTYAWNLAAYGDLMYTPYAGHLALPFLIYAVTFALEKKPWKLFACFLTGGLFHPPLTICMAGILGLYWLWSLRSGLSIKGFLLRCLGLIVCLAISVVPHQISMYGLKQISDPEKLTLILINSHTVPWIATLYLPAIIKNTLKLLPLLVLAFAGLRVGSLTRESKKFLVCAALASLLLTVGHVIICELRIIPLMRLILHRSSLLVAVLAVPYAMSYLVNRMRLANWPDRFVVASALMSPGVYLMLSMGAVGLPLAYKDLKKKANLYRWLRPLAWLGYSLTLVMVAPNFLNQSIYYFSRTLYHTIGLDLPWPSLPLLEHVSVYVPVTAALAVVMMWWADKSEKQEEDPSAASVAAQRWRKAWVWITAVMCLGFVYFNHVSATWALTADARNWHDVQIWARHNTKPDSNFTLSGTHPYYSWRSLADRPVVSCYRVGQYYVYGLEAKAYDRRLEEFYKRHCAITPEDFLHNNVHTCFLSLDENTLREFAHEFHSNYLVTRIKHKFNFPIVYKNGSFVVYKLR